MRVQQLLKTSMVAIVFAAMLSGCSSIPSNSAMTSLLEIGLEQHRLERTEHVSVGRFALTSARFLMRLAGEDIDEREVAIIKSLDRVEVSTYTVHPPLPAGHAMAFLDLEESLADDGWQRLMMSRDDGENTILLTRDDGHGAINGMVVVVASGNEVEIVQLEGDLDEFLTRAIADDPDLARSIAGT